MVSSISSNLSSLNAHGKKLAVTSNNIANCNSDEFKKSRAILEEGLNNSVEVEISRVDTPGPIVTETVEGETRERELSNVDLAEELVQTIPAQRGYEANLVIIKTRDEMLGSVLDILG